MTCRCLLQLQSLYTDALAYMHHQKAPSGSASCKDQCNCAPGVGFIVFLFRKHACSEFYETDMVVIGQVSSS